MLIGLLTTCLLWLAGQSQAQPKPYWRLPLNQDLEITRSFSPPTPNWLPGHRGVDLMARTGQSVFAPTSGQVTFVGDLAGREVLVLKHGDVRSTYEPVQSNLRVGDLVNRGSLIGQLRCGKSHCCTLGHVTCLHWGLRRGLKYLNPLSRLEIEVTLIPLTKNLARHGDAPVQRLRAVVPWIHAYKVA